VNKQCEYCKDVLDYVCLYDEEALITFCHDCRYEYIKSLSYIDIWKVFERNGEVKEVFVGDNEEQEGE
jgi:hypothetical protein